MLQKRVAEKLQKATEGSDVKQLQEMICYGYGVLLPPGLLKESKSRFRSVMTRQEERAIGFRQSQAVERQQNYIERQGVSIGVAQVSKFNTVALQGNKGKEAAPSHRQPQAAHRNMDKATGAPTQASERSSQLSHRPSQPSYRPVAKGSKSGSRLTKLSRAPTTTDSAATTAREGWNGEQPPANTALPLSMDLTSLFEGAESPATVRVAGSMLSEGLGMVQAAFDGSLGSLRKENAMLTQQLEESARMVTRLQSELRDAQSELQFKIDLLSEHARISRELHGDPLEHGSQQRVSATPPAVVGNVQGPIPHKDGQGPAAWPRSWDYPSVAAKQAWAESLSQQQPVQASNRPSPSRMTMSHAWKPPTPQEEKPPEVRLGPETDQLRDKSSVQVV